MIPRDTLQLPEVVNNFRNRLSQVAGAEKIERAWMKRLHDLLELIEDVVDVEAETKVVDAAVAITLNLERPKIGTAFKQARACHHHDNAKRIAFRRLRCQALTQNFAEESGVVLGPLK